MRHKPESAVGDQRFEIVRPLGSGGFGTVYEAIDAESGQRVALKELTRVGPGSLFRFKQEFRALSDVHHPNLVSIKELIEQAGRWYIVMELIDGQDLMEFVRVGDGYDEQRLRQAFQGVALGLEALHGYGILHRDLKPSNVRVTSEGRAVLLDFGLATSVDSAGQSTHSPGTGTLLYMAPEQIEGRKLGRSADWYSFGACLYQALTGRLPYEGGVPTLLALEKMSREAVHPGTLVSGLPEDLASLSLALLQISAERRPSGAQALAMLDGARWGGPVAPMLATTSLAAQRVFAGREAEIEHLERALARTDEGMLRIVLIEGESGVGKSELAAEFLRQQHARDPRTLTLRARCYENEQVSYKAFDGCIDDLAPVLKRMGAAADALVPPDAALLAQLFPVLGDVPAIVQAKGASAAADPAARRLQAFAALALLFARLAEEHPLILLIDDLQWADAESFRLLRALVEDAHKPPILVIASVRPRDELEPAVLSQLEAVRAFHCVDVIPILGLPRPRAEELARLLLGAESDPKWASVIALESRGHPLFLSELVHFSRSRELDAHGTLSLEAALKARIERLPKQACALLELVALAGRPHQLQLFADALEVEKLSETVSVLLGAKLLRVRRDQELVCFHDRIRQVTLSLIASGRTPLLHRQLALALERDLDADPTEQAAHWDLAGETEQALNAYERAADQALDSLAFAQAERLYARALELLGSQRDERYALLTVARAHAVACGGRSAEAAALYQRAAGLARGEEQRLRLRSKTAQHLMLSGDVASGLAACRELLAELGVSLPESEFGALLRAVWDRVCLRLAGYTMRSGPRAIDEAKKRLVLDLLNDLMKAFRILRTSAFLALSGQHARRALALADPAHGASALANEGWLHSTQRGRSNAGTPFFARSRALCEQSGDPAAKALLAQQEGSSRVANWDWHGGSILLEEAEQLYRTHVAQDPWSLTVTRYLLGLAWYRMGEHARLAQQMDLWIGEAHERNDRVAVALLSGMGNGSVRHLMRGAPHEALRELDEAIASVPSEPFSFVHLGHLVGTNMALLGVNARAARDWFGSRQKQHNKPILLRSRFGKEALMMLRTNAALRAYEGAGASERKVILAEVRQSASALAKRPATFTKAFGLHFMAQADALAGQTERALSQVRMARQGFEQLKYAGVHATLYLEGMLDPGRSGAEKCSAALSFFRAQGWVEPEDAIRMMLPALPALNQQRAGAPPSRKKLIHHYEVLGALGSGGFGTVCEARDVQTGRRVALKELVSTSARSLERFKREFRALNDVHHPNLVGIDALIEDHGTWYIVMELVRGEDLISYVRPSGRLDPERLRKAFAGLFAGVSALHEAGFVHRDISPSNVCVTPEGRAVLLDFGLLARVHEARDASLGNADYASPEQLEGSVPAFASDLYALGSCLYHALSGRPPFEAAHAAAVSALKRARKPRALSTPGLRNLCACALHMLEAHPAARPSLSHVMEQLAREEVAGSSHPPLLHAVPDAPVPVSFQGRSVELAALGAAAQRARAHFTLVLVEGDSGLGKSALVAEFARRFEGERADALVLASRCYENELLPFKAFDEMVDQLARALRALPPAVCDELLPKKAAVLAQLFPVLGTVPAIAKAAKKGLPADPTARRQLGLSCLIELLERLSVQRPLLLLIDDLQWADVESLRLLAAVSHREAALPVLAIATSRRRRDLDPELSAELSGLDALPSTSTLALGQLTQQDIEALSASLLGPNPDSALLRRLGEESKGHPLFLRELVEQAKSGADAALVSLDDALSARMARFDAEARALVALLALAGRPYSVQVFAKALGRVELPRDSLNELLNQGLVRRRGEDGLTCYHDRIRHSALASLSESERRELAFKLVTALAGVPTCEDAERARLWEEAGRAQEAIPALEAAGNAALEKLAFQAAEQHYARALTLIGAVRDERWRRLTSQRGHALVRMGKNAQAARLYAAAAEGAGGELRVRLRIWAAQNLIQGAQVEEGLRAAGQLLAELGAPMVKTDAEAKTRILWEGTRLRLRGSALRPAPGEIASSERLVLDALNELSQPVASVMFLHGAALSVQHVRRALAAGDPAHAARALAYEGIMRSTRHPERDHSALFARARELAHTTGDPAVIASVEIRRGIACISLSDFEAGAESLLAGHELVSLQCPGQPWLLTTARMYLGTCWMYLGEHLKLAAETQAWERDAYEREDLYGHAALVGSGCGYLRHLMADDPGAAESLLADAMAPWPDEPFSTNHFGAAMGTALTLLYAGGDGAQRWFEQNQRRFERAAILRNPILQIGLGQHRIAACFAALPSLQSEQSRALLASAQKQQRTLRKIPSRLGQATADYWLSVLQACEGDRERALATARRAQRGMSALHHVNGIVASYWLGWLEADETGRARREQALQDLAVRGWKVPERAVAMLLPVFHLLPGS